MGSLTAYSYSLFALFTGREVYFDTAAMIVTLILAGRLFESSARHRAAAGLDRLLQLAPPIASRLVNGQTQQIDSRLLELEDFILAAPGDRFPVDGLIISGSSEVDEAAVSGESLPIFRQAGESVRAGTQNLNGTLTLKVEAKAADSFIARIGRMVSNRGFALMAVGGNIVTAWSWFGVNQLSVGLHSYGFTQSATFWLLVFVCSQLLIVFVGFLPTRLWKSGSK